MLINITSKLKYLFLVIIFNKTLNNKQVMSKVMFDYTKSVLQKVSFDTSLFYNELEKAIKYLLPYEMELLREWLLNFTQEKPELKQCLVVLNL